MRRVVITGLGAITPIGNNVNDFWNNLLLGKSGASPITKFDPTNFRTKFACEVKGFDPLQYMDKSEVRRNDLFIQYAIASVDECIKDSSIDLLKADVNNIGVIWGSGMCGMKTYEEELFDFFQNNKVPRFSPFFATKLLPNMAPGQIAIKYGLRGPSYSIAAACTSSNNAIADAFNLIRLEYANIILAGGSEAPICMAPVGGFNAMRALSERNDSPETASRPFDVSRNGFVLGEGAGVLMIEELEHALNRGAKIYCELLSCGLSSDGYHITASHPEGLGAILAMEQALRFAKLKPDDVDHINAHATSTPVGDISESKAITTVFEKSLEKLHISATKSMTGHLMGAAGAVEAIATVLAIKNNRIPPSINQFERDSQIEPRLNLTPNKSIELEVNVAMNNTFGFGGHIASSLFGKYKK
jgi:3-oxoacyl-[acyl-carrier-protein] synthase II